MVAVPVMSQVENEVHQTFTALMWTMSHPGRPQTLPASGLSAFALIADTLVDLETSYFVGHPELETTLARTGARARPPRSAMYLFLPELEAADLPELRAAPRGSHEYPDESATLVIGCRLDSGTAFELRGPGIADVNRVTIGGVPAEFWQLRAEICHYPLGWDIFLLAGDQVIGLPRTTTVQVVEA